MNTAAVLYGAVGGLGIAVFGVALVLILRDWQKTRPSGVITVVRGASTKASSQRPAPASEGEDKAKETRKQPPPEELKERRAGEAD